MRTATLDGPSPAVTHAANDGEGHVFLQSLQDALDVSTAGGKAATLGRLVGLGVRVPDGVVLTTAAFSRWSDASGLGDVISTRREDLASEDPNRRQAAAAHIRARVMQSLLPSDVETSLDEAFRRLWDRVPLVVRSSGVGEDGRLASFAGQLDSVLHVRTRADLARAVRQCWASCWSDRALFYRQARGVSLDGVAVLIQRQIAPSLAGVLFTESPQDPSSLVVEYGEGLADALVSGQIDPARVSVGRADIGVAKTSDLPPDIVRSNLLPIALRLEQCLGGPQDIEWAIDAAGTLWIVQARPITTASASRRPIASPTYWSDANVNENFPAPISPLLYSIASTGYYHYFRNLGLAFGVSRRRLRAMDGSLRGIIGVHAARMYYNLTNIHAVLRMAPFGESLARSFNQFVGATDVASSPAGAIGWSGGRIRSGLELARIAACTAWQYLFFKRRLETFEREIDACARDTHRDRLSTMTRRELAGQLRRFIDIRQHRWKNASLADAAAMVCYSVLKAATRGLGAAGDASLHNRLLCALPGVPSGQPPVRLWALSRLIRQSPELTALFASGDAAATLDAIRSDARFGDFRAAFDRYLEDWGFRSSSELMLTEPGLDENPVPVVDLLARHAADDHEPPPAIMARQAAARRRETRQVLRRLAVRAPHRALALALTLAATRRAITFRERARLKQALLYSRLRGLAREIGRRLVSDGHLESRDDVFMLGWEEIDELVAGRAMFPGGVKDLVRLRARHHATCSAWQPPGTFVLEDGDHWRPGAGGHAVSQPLQQAPDSITEQIFRGTSACGGVVTARASVLEGVADAHRLRSGAILITRQTDPGWAPVFCLIGGLVIERGGMLSHGAVIAREFGLPCVVGVPDATRRIPDGALLTVDGDAGTCHVAEPRTEAPA